MWASRPTLLDMTKACDVSHRLSCSLQSPPHNHNSHRSAWGGSGRGGDAPPRNLSEAELHIIRNTIHSDGASYYVGATYFPGPSPAKYRGQKRA